MNARIFTGTLAVLMLTICLLAGCGNPMQNRREMMIQKISEKLELTDLQKQSLVKMQSDVMNLIRAGTNERKTVEDGIIALVKSDTLDVSQLDVLVKSMQSNRQAYRDLIRSDLIEFHKTLTPAQKEKAAKMIENFYAKVQELMQ
jgi:Spy/CpxP family protein refolding chaperone